MLKLVLAAVAAAALVAACGPAANQESTEATDTGYEQSMAGTTDPSQAPVTSEPMDATTEGQPSGDTTTQQPTTPPPTTP